MAEEILGRPLGTEEVVHHEDGNRSNNHPSNLMVFKTNSDHTKHHMGTGELVRLDDGTYIRHVVHKSCCMCGRLVLKGTYCSFECSNASKSRQPEREERGLSGSLLWKKVWAYPMTTIAKELGVSDNAIRKGCKAESIPLPQRGYWRKVEVGALEEGLCCPLPTIP